MPRSFRLLVLVLLLVLAGQAHAQQGGERPRNVILFVSDGTGPASITLARDFARATQGRETLALDGVLVGSLRTYATDSRVTDSAAGATAFAAGVKTYNGAISVDTLRRPVATLLEAAEARGMATGLVATSTITHATPAAFSAHVPSRADQTEIALQQLAQDIEVMLGGGTRFFRPEAAGGRRKDGRDLMQEAAAKGYQVVTDRAGLQGIAEGRVLGLFTPDQMSYDIDRDPEAEPSLAEMTRKALELLASDPDGFFLMVEGSRIDHAAHGNDAAAHLRDLLAFDDAVAEALAFAARDGRTLVVATSDHETGGLTLGRNLGGRGVYAWYPEVLAAVKSSHGPMINALLEGRPPAEVLAEYAGITDLDDAEVASFEAAKGNGALLNGVLAEAVARRAVLGWTTGGHTAVDVNLYAAGPGADTFRGHHDNTYVGRQIAQLLGFDLEALSQRLRQAAGSQ